MHGALTRNELDAMGCARPGCDHTQHRSGLTFHGRCHPHAPTWAIYGNGVLSVRCAECDQLIADVQVAGR